MNNIEEDFRLFQLVRRKPIKNCIDLTKGLRGKTSGIFYFTEAFRIDFENKMCDLERLKAERKQDKARIKELEEENRIFALEGSRVKLKLHIEKNYISKQEIKDYLKEEEERYKVYKRESEANETLKLGMWKHLGAKNMCEKILGIENIATLD